MMRPWQLLVAYRQHLRAVAPKTSLFSPFLPAKLVKKGEKKVSFGCLTTPRSPRWEAENAYIDAYGPRASQIPRSWCLGGTGMFQIGS